MASTRVNREKNDFPPPPTPFPPPRSSKFPFVRHPMCNNLKGTIHKQTNKDKKGVLVNSFAFETGDTQSRASRVRVFRIPLGLGSLGSFPP